MSDILISARGLTKTYRLYTKPHYRFLDLLGLLSGNGKYTEHHALHGVDLDIRRGEKVALIGRNGAGKSTLLKMITGVTQPSAGSLTVRSKASALLQIGTTFHPEFTGRENVLSYLAHLGITGGEADEKLAEIIEFSELEEYIDQPVKTYSTGMGARLMFSSSTVVVPELLVIDEVLSVGDAYFAHKSFERIKELSDRDKTTVLLVSHDVYSAAKLCNRMIWFDRGSKLLDAASEEVIKAYEHSIRLQEESRLRTKAASAAKLADGDVCVMEMSVAQQQSLRGQLLVRSLRILDTRGSVVVDLPLSDSIPTGVFEPSAGFVTYEGETGQSVLADDVAIKRTRLAFELDGNQINAIACDQALLEICYYSSQENIICIDLWRKEHCIARTLLNSLEADQENAWRHAQLKFEKPSANLIEKSNALGTGRIWIEGLEVLDESGEPSFVFSPRNHLRLRCKYRNQGERLMVEFLMAIHRDGISDVVRMVGPYVEIPNSSSGTLNFYTDGWELARGRFTFTLIAVKPGYYDNHNGQFFSINNDVYCCINRGVEILIDGGSNQFGGTNVRIPMKITVEQDLLE